ncbi:hypothetical protein J6590_004901 [Homalodisca vitripennis]|nr:hypothetical protein J6590_004901 [Homalodisca vitripennis]
MLARCAALRAACSFRKKINSSSSKFEAQITSVPLITNSSRRVVNTLQRCDAALSQYPHHCLAFALSDHLIDLAQLVSFTAAIRSVEPVSTELMSLPARGCYTGHRVDRTK